MYMIMMVKEFELEAKNSAWINDSFPFYSIYNNKRIKYFNRSEWWLVYGIRIIFSTWNNNKNDWIDER